MGIPDVRLVNLSKRYGDVVAVDSITLDIQRGVYCCLLGPSGCGKSSTLRMIAGHESISSGSIYVGTQEVSGLPPARRNTAMMFQDYALFPHMSLVDNVAFGLKMRGVGKRERRRRAEEILDLVGMAGHLQQRPGQLSGGQRQRVALARALITEPAVVLLDEPLSALDRFLRVRMRGELRRLQQQFGVTFIHVTHSQEEALALADLVVVMEGGKIQQVGPPREVYNQARTPFVASFIGDHNVLQGRVVANTDGFAAVEGPEGGRYAISGPAQVGETMCFTVRADHARLVHSTPPDVNVISGTAVAVEYAGHFMRVRLTTAGGIEFLVYVPDEEFVHTPVALGQTVGACWPRAAAVPLMITA